MSSDNEPTRITNAWDREEVVYPDGYHALEESDEPGQTHTGEVSFEGDESMLDDWLDGQNGEATDEPVSASESNDLEHDPDWLGVQLTKLKMLNLARRAFRGVMDDTEIEKVALELIYANQYNPKLDLAPPEPGATDLEPSPVDDDVVAECRQAVSAEQSFDLPESVDFTIVRRWVCDNCGQWGSVRKTDRCGCDTGYESNSRHLQFTLKK